MAILSLDKRMVFWSISIGGQDMTSMLKEYVNSLSVTYSINGVTKAEVDIISESFVEDIMSEEQSLSFSLGYDSFRLVEMFNGKIKKPPQGQASDKISYRITAVGKETSMATEAKNKVFQIPVKSSIIAQVAAENGYIPFVVIADTFPIPAKYQPIQKNQTDLEFLNECARKWNCIMWFDEPNFLYFYDAGKAHTMGDNLKYRRMNIEDLLPYYELGFRTDYSINNISNISWDFKPRKGGGYGSRSNTGADEGGSKIDLNDFSLDYDNKTYKLKSKFLNKAKTNPTLFLKYAGAVINSKIASADVTLRTYFVPVTHGSSTNKNLSHTAAHMSNNLNIKATMNIGDPYLRPPRNAWLYSGSLNPAAETSDLPNFLFKHGEPQKYKINEVTTSYKSGKIDTTINMSMGASDA